LRDLRSELASLRIEPRPAKKRRRLLPLAASLLVVAAAAYAVWWTGFASSAVPVEAVRPTVIEPGQAAPATPILTAAGYIVARRKAVVSAKVQGRLGELRVEEGSRVAEGEIIAKLENLDIEAQVERARAQVAKADAELTEAQRQARLAESLSEGGVVSSDELDLVRSRLRIAEATVRQARAEQGVYEAFLENTNIRAPFAGVVIKKMAEVGESVAPIPPGVNVSTSSGAIVVLADMNTLEMEADVNEANIAKLRNGQKAEIVVEAFPDRRYAAIIRQIIPSADRTKATVLVKVTLLEKDDDLKPEMSARANFLEEPKEPAAGPLEGRAIRIPADAVISAGGASSVLEVVGGKVLSRPVVIGDRVGSYVEIREGLTGMESLVLKPPPGLQSGDAVEVKP
jgi:HlyD family secretion protein